MSTALMHQTGISLVIPAYNRASLIGETIDSALAQTIPFKEIIVVDDASTDNTSEVLAAFGDRITVIKIPKAGVQCARNTGVRAAGTPFIALCDSDDLLLPDYNATLLPWLEAHPECDAVYCNFVSFTESGDQPDKFSGAPAGWFDGAQRSGEFWHDIPDLYVRTVAYQALFSSGNLIRKSVYEALGGYDTRFNGVGGEDWEFTLRLTAACRMALCATPLARIRKHAGNDSVGNLRQNLGCIQILEYALKQHPVARQYHAAILDSIDERRLNVFADAFAQGNFELASQTLGKLRAPPADLRFRLKALITRLPGGLRQPLWRRTQAR